MHHIFIYYIASLSHIMTLESSRRAEVKQNYIKMTKKHKNFRIVIGKCQSKSIISIKEKKQAEKYGDA